MDSTILQNPLFLLIILLWILPWKGISLWKSARNGHKYWFISLLLIQTFAVLDIIYIFFIDRRIEGSDNNDSANNAAL